ncbi:hypothetical protein LCGC14_0749150 [marine sediment metagenome]|uniref:Uncharacterized protein n=1 Tax=marine sediment metagenome TaxID=412755 RepID=A0A0F9Q4H5_9ZZZZ
MIEDIARIVFETAVEQAPHAEWEHKWWEDMTDEDKLPFQVAARRIADENLTNLLTTFIYLWTRDADMPANQDTEDYMRGQLIAIKRIDISPIFSDSKRAEMARRILVT